MRVQNGLVEDDVLGNLVLVQQLKRLTDRKQRQGLPQATDWAPSWYLLGWTPLDPCWTEDLFIGQLFFLCVYLPMCARVSLCVCTLTRRGVCLIGTTEHSSRVTFSAILRSNQTLGCVRYRHTVGR